MKKRKIKIIKASGNEAVFEVKKLIASLRKSGASEEIAQRIASEIERTIYEGMTTKGIYKKAFAQLKKHSRPTAARYKLKKAIMELGDTGYPFEKFVGALLSNEGYQTQVGVIVKGRCVNHEIDVIAENDSHHYMCECKFHNKQGRHCNVKIPLYIQSRFKDVEAAWRKNKGHEHKFHQGWIFTNTRFSTDAERYGICVGLQLISWGYPKGEGIKDRVDRTGVHPVTCLTTLTMREKKALIEKGKILCMDLVNEPQLLNKIKISENRHQRILDEASKLCNNKNEQRKR